MKKIVTLCSLILCISILVTVFVSCGDEKVDSGTKETETYIASITNGEFGFTAEVGETETIIKNNGEVYQTLKYPVNSGYPFDYNYAKERSQFIDMNFDGQPDFYIAVSAEAETIYYYCWLFNATTKKFDYSVSLSGLTNISVDTEKQIIYSTFEYADTTKIVSYRWENGQLKNTEIYDNSSDTIPAQVTEAAKENAIGVVTRPALTTKAPQSNENNKKPDNNSSGNSGNNTDNTNKDKNDSNINNNENTNSSSNTTTKKNDNNSDNNTSAGTTVNNVTDTDVSTTVEDKPLNTTTTEPQTQGVMVENGNIDDGWF